MRTYVVTGSASGIGAATADRLRAAGHRVIGVDLHGADVPVDVPVDLSTVAGREAMVAGVAAESGGSIDAVIACAGMMGDGPQTISVNYFGAVASVDLLRPMLAESDSPRAVVIASIASIIGAEQPVVDACLDGEEAEACRRMAANPPMAYLTSKAALARWVRRTAPTPEWAGAGIALNAVAPGTVETPMTVDLLSTAAGVELTDGAVPMPLNGHARAEHIAPVIEFLASADNTHMCGQVVFVDGGADAVLRGDSTW